jgi:hypothetical protein
VTILFVAPNPLGSGEALTALEMARQVARAGHDILFAGTPLASRLVAGSVPAVVLPDDPIAAQREWRRLAATRSDAIVFADYPLLALNGAGRAILDALHETAPNARLVTLDHLGMARGPLTLPFGPPHLEPLPAFLPALPEGMATLLPCPLRSPTPATSSARGIPFRSFDVPPSATDAERRAVRARFNLDERDRLVFHSAPGWAVEFCRRHELPYYNHFTRLLERLLSAVRDPVTVVSVNGGSLLRPSSSSTLRVLNLGQLAPDEYDALLVASDLFLTDNRISVSLARAARALVPAVALRNSYRLPDLIAAGGEARNIALMMEGERMGSIFPFEVFPIWSAADVAALGVFDDNPLADAIVTLELFAIGDAPQQLARLLEDDAERSALRDRQRAYVSTLTALPTGGAALLSILGQPTGPVL